MPINLRSKSKFSLASYGIDDASPYKLNGAVNDLGKENELKECHNDDKVIRMLSAVFGCFTML